VFRIPDSQITRVVSLNRREAEAGFSPSNPAFSRQDADFSRSCLVVNRQDAAVSLSNTAVNSQDAAVSISNPDESSSHSTPGSRYNSESISSQSTTPPDPIRCTAVSGNNVSLTTH
jgi:hypothetical protein